MDEPTTEIGRKRARRAKWFFTWQIGSLVVVMAFLALVAVANITDGENTGWWVVVLAAEPVVLAALVWLARRSIDEAGR
jgi:hypothetical protein